MNKICVSPASPPYKDQLRTSVGPKHEKITHKPEMIRWEAGNTNA